jgi:hypothetical protein
MDFVYLLLKTKKVTLFYSLIITIVMIIPLSAEAQMFSVKNTHHRTNEIPHFHIYAGAGPAHFDYRPNDNKGIHAFHGQAFQLVLEAYNFKIYLSKGLGLDQVSFFETGIQGGYKLPVYHSTNVHFGVPVQLQLGLTTVTNDEQISNINTRQFREGNLSARIGADLTTRLTPLLRLNAGIIPSFGLVYSASRNTGGGSVFGAEGDARLYFDHLFGSVGLSLGYGYRFRRFDIKGNDLDYNAIEHKFLIGVTF